MDGIKILNKTSQTIIFNFKDGTHDLLGGSTMTLHADEFSTWQVQNLLQKGKIIVKSMEGTPKKKWKSEGEARPGTSASAAGEPGETEGSVSEPIEKEQGEVHETEPRKMGFVKKRR